MTATHDDYLAALAGVHAAGTAAAEIRLLEALIADVPTQLPLAERAGIGSRHFPDEDLRIIWLLIVVARDRPRLQIYRLARRALRDAHYWDAREIAGNYGASRWSDATLHVMWGAMFPSEVGWVELCARRLIDLHDRRCEAHAHLRVAASLLDAGVR